MAVLRLFAGARQAAGTGSDTFDATSVADVITAATERYGQAFAAIVPNCRVWLNGDEAELSAPVGPSDEVALLPPVSGG